MVKLFSRRSRPTQDDVAALTKSRRIIVDAYEVERRRIERDLHDGAQQYLVAASLAIGEALDLASPNSDLATCLDRAQSALEQGLAALRHTVHGIHPQVLTDLGLLAALQDLVDTNPAVSLRSPHRLPPLPEGVLATAYFFCCEAITNARKYTNNAPVSILVTIGSGLNISVVDEGPGGAVIRPGGGLEGMRERVAAIGGTLTLLSPPGGPTQVSIMIPLLLLQGEPSIAVGDKEQ